MQTWQKSSGHPHPLNPLLVTANHRLTSYLWSCWGRRGTISWGNCLSRTVEKNQTPRREIGTSRQCFLLSTRGTLCPKAPREASGELRNQLRGFPRTPALPVVHLNAQQQPLGDLLWQYSSFVFSQVQKLPPAFPRAQEQTKKKENQRAFSCPSKSSLSRASFTGLQRERSAEGNSQNNSQGRGRKTRAGGMLPLPGAHHMVEALCKLGDHRQPWHCSFRQAGRMPFPRKNQSPGRA